MRALLLIAHGSRREASNREVEDLACRVRDAAEGRFDMVRTGFLEIAPPSIPEALAGCIESGATSVVIVPCFLAAGRHVAEDIPSIVEAVARRHPQVDVRIAEHIGMCTAMAQLILDSARGPSMPGTEPRLQYSA